MNQMHHQPRAAPTRAEILTMVKRLLQPYFDEDLIDRDQFVVICKQTLEWAWSSTSLREFASPDILQPLIETQLKSFGVPIPTPSASLAMQNSHSYVSLREPSTSPKVSRGPSRLRPGPSMQPVVAAARARDQTSIHIDGTDQVQELMSRFFLFGTEDHRRDSLLPEDTSRNHTHFDDKTVGPQSLMSSCSAAPVDPEDLLDRQRRYRLAALRRSKRTEGSVVLTGAEGEGSDAPRMELFSENDAVPETSLVVSSTAASLRDDLGHVVSQTVERCYQQQAAMMEYYWTGIERRQALLQDESSNRQLLVTDESSEFSMLLTREPEMYRHALWKERMSLERGELLDRQAVVDAQAKSRYLLQEEFVVAYRGVQDVLDQREREREALESDIRDSESMPPPPTTPKPLCQFDNARGDAAAGDEGENERANQLLVIQQLRAVVTTLPHQQRIAAELRIAALETKINERHNHRHAETAPPQTEESRTTLMSKEDTRSSAQNAGDTVVSTPHRRTLRVDPYGKLSVVTPPRPTRMAGGKHTPKERSHTNGVSDRVAALLQPPDRTTVVEFLRSLLQPVYNTGALPREIFVDLVRHISKRFFSEDWIHHAEQLLGKEAVHEHRRHPRQAPELWKVYLHRELCEVLGEDTLL